MNAPLPDWQLPPGVSRGLWQYLTDDRIAQSYDAILDGGSLATIDVNFVHQHCQPPGRLIDLGCGTGRLLLPLAECGYRVVGVDLSLPMLGVARAKASAAGLSVELMQANLVDLDCFADCAFNHAACLFSTLGMIAGFEHRQRMIQHVHRILRPGGVFVLHVHNRWFNIWQPQGWKSLLGDMWQTLRRLDPGDRHMPGHGQVPPLTLHMFTRREAIRLLRRAGFAIRAIRPVTLRTDGVMHAPHWFGWLRAYGYLIAAVKTH